LRTEGIESYTKTKLIISATSLEQPDETLRYIITTTVPKLLSQIVSISSRLANMTNSFSRLRPTENCQS